MIDLKGICIYNPKEINGNALSRIQCVGYDGTSFQVNIIAKEHTKDAVLKMTVGEVYAVEGDVSMYKTGTGEILQIRADSVQQR